MATAAKQGAATRTTVLPNGLTIATENNPSAGAATVGVWIDAGSRLESVQTHGVANVLERAAIQVRNSLYKSRKLDVLIIILGQGCCIGKAWWCFSITNYS